MYTPTSKHTNRFIRNVRSGIKTFKVSKKTKKGLIDKPISLKQRISRFVDMLLSY